MNRILIIPVGGINLVHTNSANGLVVNEVYVLQNGKCTNFANDSGKQTIRYFLVVPEFLDPSASKGLLI